jgi:hypothetical protein
MQAVAIEDADRNTDDYAMIFAAQKGETEAIEYLLKKYKRIVLACVRYYFCKRIITPTLQTGWVYILVRV